MNQYIMVRPTEPTPERILAASSVSLLDLKDDKNGHSRVEKIPVPIIWLMFKHIAARKLTEYPNGELVSTGAPDASW